MYTELYDNSILSEATLEDTQWIEAFIPVNKW